MAGSSQRGEIAEGSHYRGPFIAAFIALIGLHVALLSSERLYPFTDLPNHLAAATIARYIGEPSNQFNKYYTVDAYRTPNTFHMLFCSLRIFPSVEFANKVFFCIYAALLPISVLLIIRKLGGSPWFSLLSFLLAYNYSVSWGFVGFAFSVPLVLLFYRFFIIDPNALPHRTVPASLFLLLLCFVHVVAALFALMLVFLGLVFNGKPTMRRLASSLLTSAPLVLLIALWWHFEARSYQGSGIVRFIGEYYRRSFIERFPLRRFLLTFDNYHLYEGARGHLLGLIFSLSILIPVLALFARRHSAASVQRDGMLKRPLVPLMAGSFLCCMLLPDEIPQQSILYERFSAFLFISFVIYGSTLAPRSSTRVFARVIPSVSLIHFLLWAAYFIDFNRQNAGFNSSFLPESTGGTKLGGLIYDFRYRGKPIYIHFPSYYIVWKKGIATSSLVDYRFTAVQRKVTRTELPKYLEWAGYRHDYDGRYELMDHLLIRGIVPTPAVKYLEPFDLTKTWGEWRLYERISAQP